MDYDPNASWYDITVEEEERVEKENIAQHPNPSDHLISKSKLSPLKEDP